MVDQRGFTIIEVMLFLAISALLFMIALVGLTSAINGTRFSDATNSLEAFLGQQYSDVRSGVAYRTADIDVECRISAPSPDPAGASDNCIVIGRLLDFTSSSDFGTAVDIITSYAVVANRCPDITFPAERGCDGGTGIDCPISDPSSAAGKLAAYCPRALTLAYEDEYRLEWGAHMPTVLSGAGQPNPSILRSDGRSGFDRIAILHSPTSERIYTYVYNGSNDITTSIEPIESEALVAQNVDQPVLMCLKSGDLLSRYHFVRLGGGQGNDFISSGDAISLEGALTCA